MKIREGAYYRTRGGDVVGPMRRFPYSWGDGTNVWTDNGGFIEDVNDCDMDLISEVYVSDTPPADAPAPEAKTLRDDAANAALTGFVANPNNAAGTEESAQWAYRYADAMMKAREK